MAGLATAATAQSTHPYVGYDFAETRHTATDERECLTQIGLSANDSLSFNYREDIRGCIDPVVRSVEFRNTRWNVTAEEQAELVQALLAAKVFDLVSEEKPASSDGFSWLAVRIGSRDERWIFWSPPVTPARKAVHEILLDFAKRMGIDRPENPEAAVTVSEGDLQPAREVSLVEVLAFPERFQGKRISVVGRYRSGFEVRSFSIGPSGYDSVLEANLWRSELSSFAKATDIDDRDEGWLRIDGVFLRGPAGHMGAYPGEIARVTRVRPALPRVPSPDEPRRGPLSSSAFLITCGFVLLLPYVAIWLLRRGARALEVQDSKRDPPIDLGA